MMHDWTCAACGFLASTDDDETYQSYRQQEKKMPTECDSSYPIAAIASRSSSSSVASQ